MFTKTCLICGKTFESKAYNAKHCSHECRLEAKRRRRKVSHKESRKTYQKDCVLCGKQFDSKWILQKYCSSECYREAGVIRKRLLRGNSRNTVKRKRISRVTFRGLCSICGAEDVPVQVCSTCGYLSCKNCHNN